MDKKGFELSINIVVVLIIGLALLIMGFVFLGKIISIGEDYEAGIDDRLVEQLKQVAFRDGRMIGVLEPSITVERGKTGKFLVGILNGVDQAREFKVKVDYKADSPIHTEPGFDSNSAGNYANHIFKTDSGEYAVSLGSGDEFFFWVVFSPPKSMPRGKLFYDVSICEVGLTDGTQGDCSSDSKLYTGNKLRLFITVV
jgi:hypothetical protein